MAVNRLFLMVYYLLEKGTATAPQLAEHFEVSVRTIYRDIDLLSAAGIPIYTTQGKGGGISIQEHFILNQSLMTEQEQDQILMALQGISLVYDEGTQDTLSKLRGLFQKQNVNWLEVDFADWNRDCGNHFHLLKHAIFQRKKVTFIYNGTKGKPTDRIVEPLKLIFRSREWYLYGYCEIRGDYRLFKLTRIKNLAACDEAITHAAPDHVFKQLQLPEEQTTIITLLFDQSMSYRVYDHFDHITETEDGNFLVEVRLPQNEWLYDFLLSFGDSAKVISPPSVLEEMVARIQRMQNKYIT